MTAPKPTKPSSRRQWLGYLNFTNPRGAAFLPTPWDFIDRADRMNLPFHLRYRFPVKAWLYVTAAAFIVIGGLSPWKIYLALGVSLLATMHWLQRRAWLESAEWDVLTIDAPAEVTAGEEFVVRLSVRSTGRRPIYHVVVGLEFGGSHDVLAYAYAPSLPSKGARSLEFRFRADRGMGQYRLGPVHLTVSDPLGIARFTVLHSLERIVRVWPRDVEIGRFPLEHGGLAMHAGVYETEAAGQSTSFLGVRPWQFGDSIRHIDWKRSVKSQELVVKEFEAVRATDITICIDQGAQGHIEFQGVSSLESMRASALAMARRFLREGQRVQVKAMTFDVPFGSGRAHAELITEALLSRALVRGVSYLEFLGELIVDLPVDSLVALFFCTAQISDDQKLVELLIKLDERRIGVVLGIYDTHAYARVVRQGVSFGRIEHQAMAMLWARLGDTPLGADAQVMLERMVHRAFIIRPGETLVDAVRAEEPEWGGSHAA